MEPSAVTAGNGIGVQPIRRVTDELATNGEFDPRGADAPACLFPADARR
jgi:hypothetical protein